MNDDDKPQRVFVHPWWYYLVLACCALLVTARYLGVL